MQQYKTQKAVVPENECVSHSQSEKITRFRITFTLRFAAAYLSFRLFLFRSRKITIVRRYIFRRVIICIRIL